MITRSKRIWVILVAFTTLLATSALMRTEARSPAVVNDQQLETEVQDYLSGLGASYGVAAIDLQDGQTVFVNADGSFPTASMYKLLVMYRVFQAVDQGNLSMDDTITVQGSDVTQEDSVGLAPGDALTVAEALNAMITVSSNAAAYALTRTVGGWSQLASAAEELEMAGTYMEGWDFWSTPRDMAHFFQLLADGSLVSPDASQQMVDLLAQQTVNDRLPALLPSEAQVAHKTGELPGVRNDGGIVQGPGGRYVVVLMSQLGDPAEEVQAEATISQMVYAEFEK